MMMEGEGGSGVSSSPTAKLALSVISDSLSEQEYLSDSGKGGSGSEDTAVTTLDNLIENEEGDGGETEGLIELDNFVMIYEFEIPASLVGRLIGRHGSFKTRITEQTGANIIIKKKSAEGSKGKICAVEGTWTAIEAALSLIRERFPVREFSEVTLEQVNVEPRQILATVPFLPSTNKLSLIEGVINDVSVTCVVNLGHIFLQQPTHPSYTALERLHHALKTLYDAPEGTPNLIRPFSRDYGVVALLPGSLLFAGVICIAQLKDEWFRAEVVAVEEEKSVVTARLVDIGGYVHVKMDALRQIRVDFVTMPFQATECRLSSIVPSNEEEGWTEEAVNFFKILTQGHFLQAVVAGYSVRDNVALIYLYKIGESHSRIFINEELVNHGYAQWIDDPEYYAGPEVDEICNGFAHLGTTGSSSTNSPIDNAYSSTSWADASSSDELISRDIQDIN